MRTDIDELVIEPADGVATVGAAVQLRLYARNGRGGVDLVPGNMAAWSSDDPHVGEVNRQGRLTLRGAGLVTITARYADRGASTVYTVLD